MICNVCEKNTATVTVSASIAMCESCALDTALSLLAATRLSNNAITALLNAGYNLSVMPVTDKHWSATDIAKELGVSAQKVGRTANTNGLKTSKYGEWRLDQANNSRKQIESFYYNADGRNAICELLRTDHDQRNDPSIRLGAQSIQGACPKPDNAKPVGS